MKISLRSNMPLVLSLHMGFWLFFILIHAIFYTRFFTFQTSLLHSTVNIFPLIILFYFNGWLLVNDFLERQKLPMYFLIIGSLIFLITITRVQISLLFPWIDKPLLLASEKNELRMAAVISNLIILVLSTLYHLLVARYKTERRNLQLLNEQNEAQLQFLKAQINPHFLFNTLNNIYSLAVVKSEKTSEMVLMLSNLLRYVIYDGRKEQVSLAREVEHIQKFIELFEMRSEHPLNIKFKVDGNPDDVGIEPMILIPIVENCFKHCDFDVNEEAFVNLHLTITNDMIQFTTENSKSNADVQKDKTGGVGLANIRKRLELKYPGEFELNTINKINTFEVEFMVRINKAMCQFPDLTKLTRNVKSN